MQKDEHAIRELIATWMDASMKGDLDTVLGLMDEDVIFTVPGREPFDREAFIEMNDKMKGTRIEGTVETHELRVLGDWAYARNYLEVTSFPANGGAGTTRRGYTLSIFRKDSRGNWLLHRDANLVM
jgi:uncharacterized protein (TIGR02246 family)